MEANCPVCSEYLFDSADPIKVCQDWTGLVKSLTVSPGSCCFGPLIGLQLMPLCFPYSLPAPLPVLSLLVII